MKDSKEVKKHTISILVYNEPGVMAKITGLITRRGFNIESLSAGDAKDKGMFRLTLVFMGDDRSVEQIQKQIYKIIDTVKVAPISSHNKIEKEMALIKIKAANGDKTELFHVINVYKGNIVDTTPQGVVVSITGSQEKVNRFIKVIPSNRVMEIARSGIVAMNRWD
jgi:acetolactate synthase I/III small subunit